MSSFLTSSANSLRHAYIIKFDWQARHKHKINASQGIENFFILLTQFCVAPGSRLLFRFFFPVEIRLISLVQAQIPHFHMLYSSSPSHTLFKSSSYLCQGSYSTPSRNLAFGTASRHFWPFGEGLDLFRPRLWSIKLCYLTMGFYLYARKLLPESTLWFLINVPPPAYQVLEIPLSPTLFGPTFINFHRFQYQRL